ncbi:MAG: DUF86 domain-containing protein [Sedimentisphaerales bacterium]|nr:DUF86 domain-containing protein [Sedimentisphaerales bacterium]
MQLDARKYLYDILSACEAIGSFTSDKTIQDYEDNLMLQSAVERQFMIIGEALIRLYKTIFRF